MTTSEKQRQRPSRKSNNVCPPTSRKSMAIVVVCPGCSVRLTLGDDRAGTTLECPKCDSPMRVPGASLPSPVVIDYVPDKAPEDEPPIRRQKKGLPKQSFRHERRTTIRQTNRIVASVGIALLLIGQFLPRCWHWLGTLDDKRCMNELFGTAE